jgi:hypothetical protein
MICTDRVYIEKDLTVSQILRKIVKSYIKKMLKKGILKDE